MRLNPKLKFVGLHAHSVAGSPFDALGYPAEHMNAAIDMGMDALALTDHGNMNGFSWQVEHAKKLKKKGEKFKPIFGCEAYFIPSIKEWQEEYDKSKKKKKKKSESKGVIMEDGDKNRTLVNTSHFLLLAKNQTGLNNLFKLVSDSYKKGNFYRKPRIDLEALRMHSEGLISTTTCISGPFAKVIWQNPELSHSDLLCLMRPLVQQFVDIFGEDYYGELQWNNIPEQHKLNKCIIDLSKEFGIKLVSTVDSHYPRENDWRDRELYKRLGWIGASKKPEWLSDKIPDDVKNVGYELYVKNGDQVFESYKTYSKECGFEYDPEIIKESIENTYEIAHGRIEDFLPDATVRLPSFVVPKGKDENHQLIELSIAGLKAIGRGNDKEYIERLKQEILVIKNRGFSKYFLTMKSIADKASSMQLTGAGRGSAAGSLVAYVLGITQIDPIKYNLLFSRFLREDATDYPDIDYDVSDPMTLKEALIEEWGDNVVVPISNWNTLKLRSLIKDISKFYNIPFTEVNAVTGAMLREATPGAKEKHGIKAGVYNPTFEEVMEFSDSLKAFLRKYPHVKTHVEALHGQVRSCSRHAGGVVVGENLDKYMPLINSGGVRQTPWAEGQNVRHLEPLGFIKFDILGLASLRMMEDAIAHILKRYHKNPDPTFQDVKDFYEQNLHPDRLNFKDQQVYKNVFHKGRWAGIFQFTETGAQTFCKQAKPTSLIDISAITSIFRPGPLSAGVDKDYVKAKENPTKIGYIHPIVREITKETYGFLIFQEQIALLAHKLGNNISLDEGNKLRKLLTKKGTGKGHEEKDKIYYKFIEGCTEKRIPEQTAQKLWNTFEYFSGYGFNKSHAVSYSTLSFQCAWLFNYYPECWMAAFLDKEPESRKEKAIAIAQKFGFKVEKLNINKSGRVWEISPDGKTLIQPLTSIKGLGEKAIDQILEHRPFDTIEDFLFHPEIVYSKLNKKAVSVLIKSQTLNCLMDDRFDHLKHFWRCVAENRPRKKEKLEENVVNEEFKGRDYTRTEKIQDLVTLTGMYPFDLAVSERSWNNIGATKSLSEYRSDKEYVWFIPREVLKKKTKHGKSYFIVNVIDINCNIQQVKCWGVSPYDMIFEDVPYRAKLKFGERWGFSSSGVSSWQRLDK
tara:strand:+ start:2240 stop:5638 length:3399 start_codon:yes stop_codon:yes gene_type:complete